MNVTTNSTRTVLDVLKTASQGGIVVVLLINFTLALIGLITYICCIKRLKLFRDHKQINSNPTSLDEKQKQNEEKKSTSELEAAKKEKLGCCGRVIQWLFFEKEYQDFATEYGHEAAVYLFFKKQLILAIFICAFLGLSILLPLHLTGTVPATKVDFSYGGYKLAERDSFLLRTTVAMISGDPLKLIAHIVLPCIYILILILFLHRFARSKLVQTYYHADNRLENMVSNYTAHIYGLPKTFTDEALLKQAVEKMYPNQVHSVRIVLDTTTRMKLQAKYETAKNLLDHYCTYEYKYNVRAKERLCCNPAGMCTQVDAIEYYAKQKANIEKSIDDWENEYVKDAESTGNAFIIFKNVETAIAFQKSSMRGAFPNSIDIQLPETESSESKVLHVGVKKANEPNDIQWQNMNINPHERRLRMVFVFVALIVIMFFFTTPLALFNTVQDIISASVAKDPSVYTTINILRQVSGNLGDIAFQYLPTFVLFILSFIAPYIITFLTELEGNHSYSKDRIVNMLRLYAYVILSSLVLPTLVLTSVDGVIKYVEKESLQDALQEMFLPASGAFFLNYALQYLILGNTWDLMRLRDVLVYLWKMRSAITKRAQKEALQVAEFDIASEYGYCLSFFGLILTYSTFNPLILVLGVIHYVVKYFIDRYNITVLYDKNDKGQHRMASDFESYEQKTRLVLQLMGLNIIIFEVFMMLYFAKGGQPTQIHLITMIFLFLCTVLYMLYWTSTYTVENSQNNKILRIDIHDDGILYSPLMKDDSMMDQEPITASVFTNAEFAKAYYPPFYFEEDRKDSKVASLVEDVEANEITKAILAKIQ